MFEKTLETHLTLKKRIKGRPVPAFLWVREQVRLGKLLSQHINPKQHFYTCCLVCGLNTLVSYLCYVLLLGHHYIKLGLPWGPLSARGSNTSVQLLDEIPAKPTMLCMIQYIGKTRLQATFTLWSEETWPPSGLPYTHSSPHLKQHKRAKKSHV